jgi:hypothetical protein
MKRKMKLRLDDLQVDSFASESEAGGVHANALSLLRPDTCACPQTRPVESCACLPDSHLVGCTNVSCDGRICVTQQFGGGDTCETGPYYYC